MAVCLRRLPVCYQRGRQLNLKRIGAAHGPGFCSATIEHVGHPHHTMNNNIDQGTFDAWRVGGCLAAFLLCCATYALVFAAEDESKLRRCITAGATAEQCLLTVYGR